MRGIWVRTTVSLHPQRLVLGMVDVPRPSSEGWWRRWAERVWGLDRALLPGGTDGPIPAIPPPAGGVFAPPSLVGILEAEAEAGEAKRIPALVLGQAADLLGLLEDLTAGRTRRTVLAIVQNSRRDGFLVRAVWDWEEDPDRARERLRAAVLLPPPPPWLMGAFLRHAAQVWLLQPEWGGAAAVGLVTRWAEGAPPGGFPHPGCPGGLLPAYRGWACPSCGMGISHS